MKQCDYKAPWYHGSPERLTMLLKRSWGTQSIEMAKAFSHKPSLISHDDDCGTAKHDGRLPGFLYEVRETLGAEDVTCLRDTAGTHWQILRDLQLKLVAELPIDDPPLLSKQEIAAMRRKVPEGATAFLGTPDGG